MRYISYEVFGTANLMHAGLATVAGVVPAKVPRARAGSILVVGEGVIMLQKAR
jgi:hypothetical protein